MKRSFLYCALLALFGCMGTTAESGKLGGIYVAEYSNKFGTTWDTLELRPLSGKNMFHLVRRKRTEVVVDGKHWPPEYKQELPVLSEYKPNQRLLTIEGLLALSVDPVAGTLTKGNVTFHQIK